MKIVYLSASYIPSRTANSMHVMQMCNAIAELGNDVHLLTPDAKSRIEEGVIDNFEFYGVARNFKIDKLLFPPVKGRVYIYALHIWRRLKSIKPDLVIGRSVPGCWVSTALGIPTVFDSHGPVWESGRISTVMFKQMIKRRSFLKMTVNSLALKNIYIKNDRLKLNIKIEVAHNGARLSGDSHIELPGYNRFKAGYFGHLYSGRGVEIIVTLAENIPNVDFVIIGGTEKEVFKWKEKTANVSNLYLLGFKSPSEVYKYRNSCDILLAPYQEKVAVAGGRGDSSKYMNPIKLLEYLSSKKPIISSDLPPIREVLNDKNAILVRPSDTGEWISAVKRLRDNRQLCVVLSENGFADFSRYYTWTARAKKLIGETNTLESNI